ncbi:MAG: hypothetical protein IH984_17500 [Planctomycetes bacterium]|nr:hypothetical protein [Planctomycetota bacterium]
MNISMTIRQTVIITIISLFSFVGFAQANYSPVQGRWLERDFVRYPDGMSLYEFGQSNGVTAFDPNGLANCTSKVNNCFSKYPNIGKLWREISAECLAVPVIRCCPTTNPTGFNTPPFPGWNPCARGGCGYKQLGTMNVCICTTLGCRGPSLDPPQGCGDDACKTLRHELTHIWQECKGPPFIPQAPWMEILCGEIAVNGMNCDKLCDLYARRIFGVSKKTCKTVCKMIYPFCIKHLPPSQIPPPPNPGGGGGGGGGSGTPTRYE